MNDVVIIYSSFYQPVISKVRSVLNMIHYITSKCLIDRYGTHHFAFKDDLGVWTLAELGKLTPEKDLRDLL